MNLFMIAKSNIRKNRSVSFALVILIIIATILLYIGISVISDMSTLIDDRNTELNGSDYLVTSPREFSEQIIDVLYKTDKVEQLEVENSILRDSAQFRNITMKEKSQTMGLILLDADEKRDMSKLNIIDEGIEKLPNSIILPYFLKTSNGYQTGDEILITCGVESNEYIIYGFAEDVLFAVPSNFSYYKCFVFHDKFKELYENEMEAVKIDMIKAKLTPDTDITLFGTELIKSFNQSDKIDTARISLVDYPSMKAGVSTFVIILMAIIIVFSLIIMLITLTIMRFAIITHIEESIKNIGSMEALGYTGRQLMYANVIQFIMITLLATGIGFVIAFACTGAVANAVSSSIGLRWIGGINIAAILISMLVILISVTLIAYMVSKKIRRISPVVALRNGIDTHNFKKNHFPLARTPWNVNVVAGLKSLVQSTKQNITVFIVVALMSFVTVFSFAINYNFNTDDTAFIKLIGTEKTDIAVVYTSKDADKVFTEISQMEHVRKTVKYSDNERIITFRDKEFTPSISVCDDFSQLEVKTITDGRYPIHDNEIALSSLVLETLDAKLGDVVTLKGKEQDQEFIIVGITQQINNLGRKASITEEGMKRLEPEFIPFQIFVYLDNEGDILTVKGSIEDRYKDLELVVINIMEIFSSTQASFNNAIILVCVSCIIITLCIITIITYMLIKIKLLKEKISIGISKAIGYTTRQLISQVIVSFSPVCIFGALVGSLMAMYLVNPALASMLSISGIRNCDLIVSPTLIITTFASIALFSVLLTAIVSLRIRKITPLQLFE
ncbi:MAG TPA: ABC transporter permease [Mobilitalea sp.]|nr:ABC transporter permease [Mobilitalea sp.]